jgi:hypothetical protein
MLQRATQIIGPRPGRTLLRVQPTRVLDESSVPGGRARPLRVAAMQHHTAGLSAALGSVALPPWRAAAGRLG